MKQKEQLYIYKTDKEYYYVTYGIPPPDKQYNPWIVVAGLMILSLTISYIVWDFCCG